MAFSDHISANPSGEFAAVTPSDSVNLPQPARALFVGGDGNVVVIQSAPGGVAVTFTAVRAGTILPVSVQRVLSTGTTATGLVALF